jgi:hypothetical protein
VASKKDLNYNETKQRHKAYTWKHVGNKLETYGNTHTTYNPKGNKHTIIKLYENIVYRIFIGCF